MTQGKVVKYQLEDIIQKWLKTDTASNCVYIDSVLDFKKRRTFYNVVKELENSDTTGHLPTTNTEGE